MFTADVSVSSHPSWHLLLAPLYFALIVDEVLLFFGLYLGLGILFCLSIPLNTFNIAYVSLLLFTP